MISADGHRSVVRSRVSPEAPDARYAGYLLWVGSLREAELPEELWLPEDDDGLMEWGRGILFAHAFARDDGSSEPGRRLLSFALYDADRGPAMRRLGVVEGDVVQHSLRPADIPPERRRGRSGTHRVTTTVGRDHPLRPGDWHTYR